MSAVPHTFAALPLTRRQAIALAGAMGLAPVAVVPGAHAAAGAARPRPVLPDHPRLVFSPATAAEQRAVYRSGPLLGRLADWLVSQIDLPAPPSVRLNQTRDAAFIAQVTGDPALLAWARARFGEFTAEILAGRYGTDDDQEHSVTATNLGFAYDWLYEALDAAERREGAAALVAVNQYGFDTFFGINYDPAGEFAYAAFANHPIQAWAGVLVAGLAAAGHHPDAARWVALARSAFVDVILPAVDLVVGDRGIWSEGTHYNQVALKPLFYALDTLRSATGEDLYHHGWVGTASWYWPYLSRPDGTFTIIGDWFTATDAETVNNLHARSFWVVAKAAAERRDRHLQAFAEASVPHIQPWRLECWDVAWYDHRLPAAPLGSTPTDRLFHSDNPRGAGGESLAVLRSGWGEDATVVTLNGGDWFGHHDHYDAGSFTIWHRGDLAWDPGYADEGPDAWQFYRRSAAHNTLLVDDPAAKADLLAQLELQEVPSWGWDGGGQRMVIAWQRPRSVAQYHALQHPDYRAHSMFETGDVVGYASLGDLSYVAVDATLAYRASQVTGWIRHLLFVKPHLVVVYDVVTTPSGRTPVWLMQTVNPASVGPTGFTVTNRGGELAAVTLLPPDPTIAVRQTPAGHRIEVSEGRGGPGRRHRFLHVFAVGDTGTVAAPQAEVTPARGTLRVRVQHAGRTHTLLLPDQDPCASSRYTVQRGVSTVTICSAGGGR